MANSTVLRHTGRKGLVFVSPKEGPPPTITVGGKTYTAHIPAPGEGTYKGDSGYQYIFPREVAEAYGQDAELSFGGQSQGVNINPSQEFRADGGGVGDLRAAPNKDGGGMMGGGFGAFQPGMFGAFGVVPANILEEFPEAVHGEYKDIKSAKYNFTDPFKFAETHGAFNRTEYEKNFNQAEDLAMRSLQNELKALGEFIPAMSALKRQETSIDNQFNQAERTKQLNSALPGFVEGVNSDLEGQRGRAQSYAQGRAPDAVTDRAFELGIRSAAADRASAGGFGARSSVARKASDLMSAEERIKLSQYGDSLLSNNVNARTNFANFQLAPTEYSNAGGQINVNPSQSFNQLAGAQQAGLNSQTMLSTGAAFGAQVQQEQFDTGVRQQTNMFNAGNKLNLSMFNANIDNEFALSKFGYKAGYANTVAGAAQTDINTGLGLEQQSLYNSLMGDYMKSSQNASLVSNLFSGAAGLLGKGGLGNLTNIGGGSKGGPFAGSTAGIEVLGNNPFAGSSAGIEQQVLGGTNKGAGLDGGGVGGAMDAVGSALSSINPF